MKHRATLVVDLIYLTFSCDSLALQQNSSISKCCWHCWIGERCPCWPRPGERLPVPHQRLRWHLPHDTWVTGWGLLFYKEFKIIIKSQLLKVKWPRRQLLGILRPHHLQACESRSHSFTWALASRASCVVSAKNNITVRINEVKPNLTFLLGGSLNENQRSGGVRRSVPVLDDTQSVACSEDWKHYKKEHCTLP